MEGKGEGKEKMGEAFVRIGKYERERGRSLGSIEDFVKRKRVEGRKGGKGEEREVFQKSKKTVRSPEMREGEAGIRLEGLIREMREEARDR